MLEGELGTTGAVQLNASDQRDMFELGQTDTFDLILEDVGRIESLTIGHSGVGHLASWYLHGVTVSYADGAQRVDVEFVADRWIDSKKEDKKLFVHLKPVTKKQKLKKALHRASSFTALTAAPSAHPTVLPSEPMRSVSESRAALGATPSEDAIIKHLCARFPALSQQDVKKALDNADGHGGRAARTLSLTEANERGKKCSNQRLTSAEQKKSAEETGDHGAAEVDGSRKDCAESCWQAGMLPDRVCLLEIACMTLADVFGMCDHMFHGMRSRS